MYPSICNSFTVIRTASARKSLFSCTIAHIFVPPGDAFAIITQYVAWMERQFNACQTPPSIYPSIFNSFPSYSNRKCKKSLFLRTAVHIFVFPGEAPAIITQYVAWMESQFSACQTPHSMYPSIFNSFRVIQCLSQCISPKIAIFTTFCFPYVRPWGNHAKCCMDGNRIWCLQIVSVNVPI